MRPFQARRFPQWLRRALNLTETNVPASLFTQRDAGGVFAPILNTIDAFQGGLGIGDSITTNVNSSNNNQCVNVATAELSVLSSPAQNFAGDPNFCYIIFAMTVGIANAIAAPRSPIFYLAPQNPFPADIGIHIANISLVTGAGPQAWTTFMGSGAPFFVPPGFVPCIFTNDMLAGENLNVEASLMKLPAGFKPY